jgi:hypothetical protein
MRRRGVRAVLHYAAGACELRALPLRATRALAARFLALAHDVALEDVLVRNSAF